MQQRLPGFDDESPQMEFVPQPISSGEGYDYQLLAGHARTDGKEKTTPQLHTQYLELTDELVRQMVEGVEVEDAVTHERVIKRPDYVVWLDKSARPISWLLSGLWPHEPSEDRIPGLWSLLAANSDGTVPDRPAFRYINIDREQWVSTIDPHGQGYTDVSRIDPTIIRSLRSLFIDAKYKEKYELTDPLDEVPTELDGKTVLIVDEVRSTGRTLDYAENFFKRAFPTCSIASTHWMGGHVMVEGAVGNADTPVWYDRKTTFGRGVGNRDDVIAGESKSITQRLGRYFLGNRLPEVAVKKVESGEILMKPDPKTALLREELKHLAADAIAARVLVMPSIKREIDDFDERALRFNHMSSFDEFRNANQRLKNAS